MGKAVYIVSVPVQFQTEPVRPPQRSALDRCTWRLVVAVFIMSVFNVGCGGLIGYPAPAFPNLNSHRNPFHMTDDEQSWVGSLLALGSTVAGPVSGAASDFLGRKIAMMTGALLTIVGLTIEAASSNVSYMYAGSFLVSFFSLINMTGSVLYMAEISPTEIRGACMSVTTLAYSVGMVLSYGMGVVLPWNWLAIFLAAFYAFPNVILAILPESPRLFILRDNREAAVHGLQWYRGKYDDEEIRAIEQSLLEESTKSGWSAWWDLVAIPEQRKSIVFCSVLYILQGFSGVYALQMFTVTIFQSTGSTTIDPNLQTIISGLCCVVGSLLCPFVVDRVGRKTLLLASAVVMCFAMAITGAFFQVLVTSPNYAKQRLYWLPLLGLSLGNVGFMAGILPVPYILTCEMFPTTTRGNAQAITMVFQNLSAFVSIKTFFEIEMGIGIYGCFFVYTGVCVVLILFVLFFMKESKLTDIG